MIPTLRTLTRKSKLGFGPLGEYTIQRILDLQRPLKLISVYFKITSINFTEDILLELKIDEGHRIDKPGASKDEYYRFLNAKGYRKSNRGLGADELKRESKALSKAKLQGRNQGR